MDRRLTGRGEQGGRRRRSWENQSFILFPPICCVVIGVRMTTTTTTNLHHQTNTHVGKGLWLGWQPGGTQTLIYWWDAISTRAVGGYQGDPSTSQLPRWPNVWHCHLSNQKKRPVQWIGGSARGVAQRMNQSEVLWLCEMATVFFWGTYLGERWEHRCSNLGGWIQYINRS